MPQKKSPHKKARETTFRIVDEARTPGRQARFRIPHFAFEEVKRAILGARYDLSLIITDATKMKKLNAIYRGKETPTDILSFPLSATEGEIYICPSETRKEAVKFDRDYDNFFAFLFIHGCTHLKGYDHGSTMEGIEAQLRRKFGV